MKKIQILVAAAAAVFTLSTGGNALAQTQGGPDFQSSDTQELQNRLMEFQKMNPQQQQAAIQQFQNMSPEQQQAAIQQFQNMSPEQRQAAMEQFQKIDPQVMMNLFQQRMNNSLREQMGITNDDEWSVIEIKIAAVRKARIALMADGGGMMGMGGMGGGGGGRGFQAMFGQKSPEAQALQAALDSDTPTAQLRSLLDKYRAVRSEKQATLVKAQGDLRALLALRQEAIAVLGNLLD